MIPRPEDWTPIFGVTTQTLLHPRGGEVAVIRYSEKVRPLRSIGAIVGRLIAGRPKLSAVEVGECERLLTGEGEHAALVSIDGQFGGKPAQITAGVVFADDYYALAEGVCVDPDVAGETREQVRQLVLGDRHGLGRRRRRYEYNSPVGWQPIVRNYSTDWLSPGFPGSAGLIVVYPASPIDPLEEVDMDALADRAIERGFAIDARTPAVDVENTAGLVGLGTEMIGEQAGARMLRAFVTLTDMRYLYSAELLARTEADWAAHRDAFTALWGSIKPIPAPDAGHKAYVPLEFWAL